MIEKSQFVRNEFIELNVHWFTFMLRHLTIYNLSKMKWAHSMWRLTFHASVRTISNAGVILSLWKQSYSNERSFLYFSEAVLPQLRAD